MIVCISYKHWILSGVILDGAIYQHYTVLWRYNAVSFLKKYSQKTPHSSPIRARYGMSLWIQHLIGILPQFLQSFIQYLTIFDHVIMALDCIILVSYPAYVYSFVLQHHGISNHWQHSFYVRYYVWANDIKNKHQSSTLWPFVRGTTGVWCIPLTKDQ